MTDLATVSFAGTTYHATIEANAPRRRPDWSLRLAGRLEVRD